MDSPFDRAFAAAVGLSALTMQLRITSRGRFMAFRRLPYPDDDPYLDDEEFTQDKIRVTRYPTGWWWAVFFVIIVGILVDHHATLAFATPMHTSNLMRLARGVGVIILEVALLFVCFLALFDLAVRPIFNHGVF